MKLRSLPAASALLLAVAALAPVPLRADQPAAPQTPAPAPAAAPAASRFDQRVDALAAQLGLTDVQKGQVKQLLIQRREAMHKAMMKSGARFRAQVRAVLTPEQRVKLGEILAAKKKAAEGVAPAAAHPAP